MKDAAEDKAKKPIVEQVGNWLLGPLFVVSYSHILVLYNI